MPNKATNANQSEDNKCYADLHIHTYYSDSTFSPKEVVHYAAGKGLKAVGITDHDSVGGIAEAIEESKSFCLEVIPGLELSCEKDGTEVHILGYLVDWENNSFKDALSELRRSRIERTKKILEKLAKAGMPIDFEEVVSSSKCESIGRLHIATLLQKKGFVRTKDEAFKRFIGNKGPYYVSGFKLSPREGIDLIKKYGGVAVLAHPYLISNNITLGEFIKYGIDGIEVYHPDHPYSIRKIYANYAKEHNLIITGGSDCHGLAKRDIFIGKVKVPYEYIEELKRSKPKNEH